MERYLISIWPDDVRNSLWDYTRSVMGSSSLQILPLSNYSFSREFVAYFLIGLVVVWLYAWNRFNRRSYEPAPFDYRVLRELQPAQMRDSLPMQRAFLLYALVLSMIYASFTFFGGVIMKVMNSMPSVGPIDMDPKAFQSPQWPLMLAFGLAGLTQLIGPLDHLEKTLRGHIHRSLGIPIRIKEYTRQLIALQLEDLAEEARKTILPPQAQQKAENETGDIPMAATIEAAIRTLSDGHVTRLQSWAREEIAQTYGVEDVLAKLVLLWRMIDSLYSPRWPRESVRDEMRPLLSRQLQEARATARYLSDLLESPPVQDGGKPSKKQDGSGGSDQTPHRTRQEQQLVTAIESMERHLYEIGAIHAVYAQRDRSYDNIQGVGIRKAITKVFQGDVSGPSLTQLVCCAAVLFIGYCVALNVLNHPLMTTMPANAWTTGLSAAYDTLLTMCVYVFPILFAIYMTAPDPERNADAPSAAGHAMSAALWAGLAALVLTAMIAMIYTWLVARSSTNFIELLLGNFNREGSGRPFLVWFVSLAPLSVVVAAFVALARLVQSDKRHYLAMVLVAILAATLEMLHGAQVVTGFPACFADPDALLSTMGDPPACWKNIVDNTASNFADMMAAFVAILFLSQSRKSGRISAQKPEQDKVKGEKQDKGQDSDPEFAPAAIFLLLCMVLMSGFPASAQTTTLPQAQDALSNTQGPQTIVLGFRNDAAPFSYLKVTGDDTQYHGYLADLCYEIFSGADQYDVVSEQVTVENRFDRIRRDGVDESLGRPVDVLCDPVTVRYDDPQRWKNSIFSPIVFAS